MLQGLDDSIQSIMIIGHNPTVYELAAKLSAQGSENYISRLSMGYPPASLSVIDAPIDKWAELDPDACTLKDMALASEYNGAERPTRWM